MNVIDGLRAQKSHFPLSSFPEKKNRLFERRARQLKTWLALRGTETLHIDAGSPWQNGFIESFNSKVRDEFLNLELFLTLREAQVKTEMWRNKYNTKRPHMSLDYRTPAQERERFFTGALPPNPRSLAL